MNRTRSNLSAISRLLSLAAISLLCGVLARAQSAVPTGAGNSASAAALRAARLQDYNAAMGAITNGDIAAAEQTVLRSNQEKPGTIEWQIEAAIKLSHLALSLRERGDFKTANTVAQDALGRLTGNGKWSSAVTPVELARAYEVVGFISERLLSDSASAKSAYLQAQQANASSKAAAAGLARIGAAETTAARVGGGKR